ncbi:fumarylacetoacetate hydrolase family protein [Kribbella sandramycini]|uniref:2-keto-4-pentenoate hydratase/2-oxohepta-3-ene-1,7-dioic acid hydratase in catechol pathway n=1 Tax=Kribbella sandramycini TaxID=60450 RepID=A0A7Y4KW08_9ACTN|nr:fumarylacetoacetate hydrolase family protein [Kribbella sandramycini]MBB6567730.1 2-keto-4-pentenoate hydratase/2-oxohepta-3-ene-1,7-dioic acid hydratase in catechol pathway [Kribbella sandramycini]NOL39673.1 fumarylacetoacetate hydrolase family protein [Kribbella sandramycini]
MRIANVHGRAALVVDGRLVDIERASAGRLPADPQELYERWDDLRAWAEAGVEPTGPMLDDVRLGPPVPRPRQVFAIGLNYRAHIAEGGAETPSAPMVFTKFASAVAGPYDEVRLPAETVDYESEMVVVVGRRAARVAAADAWGFVAGLTAGQDLSERALQIAPPLPPQFSLAKSFPGFAPIGPVLVTPDEFPDPDDIEIGCTLNGQQMQKARTSELIFGVPAIIEFLSSVLPLLPGDLIFTGSPAGIGWVREPRVLLRPGDSLVTTLDLAGSMRHTFAWRD